MPPRATPKTAYRIEYFLGRASKRASLKLFKKVGYPGRRRAEVFVLQGAEWVPASGLVPRLAGTPEWDPPAVRIPRAEAERVMRAMGLTAVQVRALQAGKEGQRRHLRPQARSRRVS